TMDDYFGSLQADWRAQPDETAAVLRRLRWHRWTPHLVLAAEMLGLALALLVGGWFAWLATQLEAHRLLVGLSAAIMLLAIPPFAIATVIARRASLGWDEQTPEALLRTGMRRAESALQTMRLGRWHIAVVAAFVALLWIVEALGLMHERGFLIFYT